MMSCPFSAQMIFDPTPLHTLQSYPAIAVFLARSMFHSPLKMPHQVISKQARLSSLRENLISKLVLGRFESKFLDSFLAYSNLSKF